STQKWPSSVHSKRWAASSWRTARVGRAAARDSDDIQVHVLVHRHGFQRGLVQRRVQDALLLAGGELARQVAAELGFQERDAVLAAALVANRVFADDLVELGAVREFDRQRVGDGALVRIVVVG